MPASHPASQVMGPGTLRAYTGEKLNGKNWCAFEFGFTAHLIGYGLLDVLDNDSQDQAVRNKVFSTLVAALESNQYPLVMKTRTPSTAWAALKAFHRKQSGQSRLLLTQKFRHARMEETEDLFVHLTMLGTLADELDQVCESKITDEDFVVTACFSIMHISRFANVVEIVMNGPIPSRPDLINKLMATDQRQKALGESGTEPQTALKASTKKGKGEKRKKDKKKGECWTCGKAGHHANECKSKKEESANSATTSGEFLFLTCLGGSRASCGAKTWILDSGASAHMVSDLSQMIDPKPVETPVAVILGDGRQLMATHRGQAAIPPNVRLRDVLYVPGLQENLFSISTAASLKGARIVMERGLCRVMLDGKEALTAKKDGGVFRVTAATARADSSALDGDIRDYHRRCGHTNAKTILLMSKQGIIPKVRVEEGDGLTSCETCLKGKMTRTAIPKQAKKRKTRPGDVVHSDLCGPMRTRSLQGSFYLATYMDDATGWIHVSFLKAKSEQLKSFKAFEAAFERQTSFKVKCLRSDGGGEYTSKEAQNYLKMKGIRWERTAPRTPQQNGRAERLNRTIMEMARCLIIDAGLGHQYWEYAAMMAAYIRNRTPTAANSEMKSPFDALWSQKPDLCQLPLFGAKAIVHVPDEIRGKLEAKSKDCIFLGFAEGAKAGVFEHVGTRKRFISRDAVIDGVRIGNDFGTASVQNASSAPQSPASKSEPTSGINIDGEDGGGAKDGPVMEIDRAESSDDENLPDKRQRRAPIRYMYEWALAVREVDEPRSASDALKIEHWRKAMHDEVQALMRNKTWELVPSPKGRSIVSGKWCYKVKTDAYGNLQRYKARYVARGFTQRPGVDFSETTSPVVSLTALRTLFAKAAMDDMEVKQLDVDSAFLYGRLNEEIYLEQPQGFEQLGANGERLVCRLRKAIYGLKQAGRVWWKLIDADLRNVGFGSCGADPCIYKRGRGDELILIAIYVDDLVIASKSKAKIEELEKTLREKYSMKLMGDVNHVLGMKVERDRKRRTLVVSQSMYARKVLERFSMAECRPIATPAAAGCVLEPNEGPAMQYEYQQAVGSLMYLAVATRPDLAYGVGIVSRFAGNPNHHHVQAVKRLMRYLRGTLDIGLRFGGSGDNVLAGYADADFGGCTTTRRSTSGFVFTLNGGAISWASRRQECAALSTTEAEYIALCSAAREAAWLRGLLHFMGVAQPGPTTIYQDNQSTIALAENGKISRRSKHIEIRYHYTRDKIGDQTIQLVYCPTDQMVADAFTKALSPEPFVRHRDKILAGAPIKRSSGGSVE
jgi:hypothetical protein